MIIGTGAGVRLVANAFLAADLVALLTKSSQAWLVTGIARI